jgi:hypothetical protein
MTTPSTHVRAGLFLGLAVFVFLVLAFGLRFLWFFGEPPLPALLTGLPDSKTEADQEAFHARLRDAFPPGTAAGALTGALAAQGFRLAAPEARVATHDRPAGLKDKCQRSGNIRWTLADDGRVATVTGGYYQHCPAH